MRILIVTDSYPPLIGGGTRAAQQLARQLSARGHVVCVVTAWQQDMPAVQDDDGVIVHRLRGVISRIPAFSADPSRYTPPPFPDPELAWRLRRVVRRFAPDLVHSYGWLTYSCRPALWRTGIPLLLATRDYGNVCALRTLIEHGQGDPRPCSGPAISKCLSCAGAFYGQPKGAVAVAAVLGQRRWLRRRTDALHTVSTFCEDVLRRHLLGGRRPPAEVLPDFREDDVEAAPDPAILNRLPREPFILFVGSFRRPKGDQLLIDAYERLDDPPPLVLVGVQGAEPLPHTGRGVSILINVPHGTVMAIWDRALFGVCPSMWPEPLGNTVHEGMSRGRAVIGTRPGGHEDMIDDDRTGLLVPAGDVDALTDALARLIAEPETRDRLGMAARERASDFTAEAVMPRIESLCVRTAATRRA